MRMIKILALFMMLFVSTAIIAKESGVESKMAKEYREFLDLNEKGLLNSIINVLGGALSIAEDAAYALLTPVQKLIKQNMPEIYQAPYRNLKAYVRLGDPICEPELLFRDRRLPMVKKAQEHMLGMKLDNEDVLELGFSLSGGGWRAMCCAVGSCVGAKQIGLLDCTMCISALSGSTWFLTPWLCSGMDIYDYRARAIEVAANGIKIKDAEEIVELFDNFWIKFAFNQPLNVIDFYGALLANSLFRGMAKNPHRVCLSDQRKAMATGKFPLPVCNATLGEMEIDEYWFEFTPYEAGSRWLSGYVPIWAFGRHFKEGSSRHNAPEQGGGFLSGIFGSAFAGDFEDIYEIVISQMTFPKYLEGVPFAQSVFESIKKALSKIAYFTDLGDMRIAWGRVPNFVYKMRGVPHKNYKELKLVDAGLDFNNPAFSTYRKPPYGDAPDIIFIFDAGSSIKFRELKLLVDHAKYNGLKFPKIEECRLDKNIISVFKDDNDIEVPVVVYLPRINGINFVPKSQCKAGYDYYAGLLKRFDVERAVSSGFAMTFNFDYTPKQAETLIAMTEFNIIAAADKIKEVMKERIETKRKFRNKK
ncbi:hypothetical protein ACFLYA_02515 [Candidatus Dependentiae bacterium]